MSMDIDNPSYVHEPPIDSPKGYALSGKIMLSAIVILFAVIVFMVVLHLYARWYILRQRRIDITRRRRIHHRRTHIVFYVDNNLNPGSTDVNQGLEPGVLHALPVFTYSDKNEPLECAVCLSEFEENEKGRVLPKCHHSFHSECIDMWFHSHSTCPLCRSPVEPVTEPDRNRDEVAVTVHEPVQPGVPSEPGSSSGLCNKESLSGRRKGLDFTGVRIEVPRRNNELDDEMEMGLRLSSPASQGRSPATRLLSLRRILSMNKKTPTGVGANTNSSPRSGTTCSTIEVDLECGGECAPTSSHRSPRSHISNVNVS